MSDDDEADTDDLFTAAEFEEMAVAVRDAAVRKGRSDGTTAAAVRLAELEAALRVAALGNLPAEVVLKALGRG